jgi:hypothetical protein
MTLGGKELKFYSPRSFGRRLAQIYFARFSMQLFAPIVTRHGTDKCAQVFLERIFEQLVMWLRPDLYWLHFWACWKRLCSCVARACILNSPAKCLSVTQRECTISFGKAEEWMIAFLHIFQHKCREIQQSSVQFFFRSRQLYIFYNSGFFVKIFFLMWKLY